AGLTLHARLGVAGKTRNAAFLAASNSWVRTLNPASSTGPAPSRRMPASPAGTPRPVAATHSPSPHPPRTLPDARTGAVALSFVPVPAGRPQPENAPTRAPSPAAADREPRRSPGRFGTPR